MNLQCPHCGTAIAISGVQAGAQVKCGACAQVFLMPQQQPVQQPVQQAPMANFAPQQQPQNPNLSQCRVCGGAVATNALTCPHCGADDPVTSWVKCRKCRKRLETTATKRFYLRCPHCNVQNPTFSKSQVREDRKSRIVLFFVLTALLLVFAFVMIGFMEGYFRIRNF
jgi:predicted Zn finger-like uncharacterized protein